MLGESEFEDIIECDGYPETITFDASSNYPDELMNEEEITTLLQQYREQGFHSGDEVGFISAWGIWDIKKDRYEGQECLVATQGLNGFLGKFDYLGRIDIYFKYDTDGELKILYMNFIR